MTASNRPKSHRLRDNARILWAITANDLVAALKNRNALTVFLLALLMVCVYRFLPNLESTTEPQNLLVYDAGQSAVMPPLESGSAMKVHTYPSEDTLKRALANTEVPQLALVIPAGFDQALASGEAVQLQGYVMNWVSSTDAAAQKQLVQAELSRVAGRAVEVRIEGNILYPGADSHGLPVSLGFCLVYVLAMTALPMLPHLFLEEKRTRTMDALMVSPAGAGQIVAGKALAGLFYCLVGTLVSLIAFWNAIVQWGLVILAVAGGSLFVVAVGLWLGMRIDNRGQLSLMLSMVIIPLLVPMFIPLMADLFPAWLVEIARLVPTSALFTLFRLSAAGTLPWDTVALSLAWVLACAVGMLALVARQVRRLDRQDEGARARAERTEPAGPASQARAALAGLLSGPAGAARAEHAADRLMPAPVLADAAAVAHTPQSGWGIAWAIAAKDIREAVCNRIILSLLLGTALLAGTNTLLPLLIQGQQKPAFIVYDQGRSTVLRELAERADIRVDISGTREEMESLVADSMGPVIGLVLPADFDRQAASGQAITLTAYISHSADPQKARESLGLLEAQLGQTGASAVSIRLDETRLYPSVDFGGHSVMVAVVVAVILFTLGTALVPLLLVEEKDAHTIDALLVSPAGYGQVVAGKALAGATYCLLAAAVLIGINRQLVVHWDVALLAVLLTTFFAVSVGLLVGILSDNPATMGMWGSFVLILLIALTLLDAMTLPGWPPLVKQVLGLLPGPATLGLWRISMAGAVPAGMLWTNAAALLAAAALVYGAVMWRVSRIDR